MSDITKLAFTSEILMIFNFTCKYLNYFHICNFVSAWSWNTTFVTNFWENVHAFETRETNPIRYYLYCQLYNTYITPYITTYITQLIWHQLINWYCINKIQSLNYCYCQSSFDRSLQNRALVTLIHKTDVISHTYGLIPNNIT